MSERGETASSWAPLAGGGGGPLAGQVAVVTGAGQGIGRVTALLLARAGASVVGAARTRADLDSLAAEIERDGGQALGVPTDVTVPAQAEALLAATIERFGRVDLLVNNAGFNIPARIDRVTDEQWEQIIGTNLDGTFYCTRAAVRRMMPRRSGKIVNVASLAGLRGSPTRTAYCAAKFGVSGFAQALAKDLNDVGISVSTVFPGPTATALRASTTPNEDPATIITPEQVAEVILFLATRPPNVLIPEIAVFPRKAL